MKKKILTISIAAYNVEKYLEKTLKSLVIENMDKLEVLIVNDGSKDDTVKIAKKYCKKYPNSFKLIDKKNGGYGSTINAGIKEATGKYFKQLDGDDWYESINLNTYLIDLEKINSDIIYTPFNQYFESNGNKERYEEDLKNKIGKYQLDEIIEDFPVLKMHSLTFKTDILKNNNIKITENCFYTDTQYVLFPLLYSRTITIFDYPIYVYRLGLAEQSVSINGKLKHYKDHAIADKDIIDYFNKNKNTKIPENIKKYIDNYMANIFSACIGNYMLLAKPSKEQYEYIINYDEYIKINNKEVYDLMAKYSKAVKIIRKRKYLYYSMLHYIKKILKRF